MRIQQLIIRIFIFQIIILFLNNGVVFAQESTKQKFTPKISIYERKDFISYDYIFDKNFGLNAPVKIKQNAVSGDYVVLDYGNKCLYVFSSEAKFNYKIGTPGQGPGDILRPQNFTISPNGDIYVYDTGNHRISIYDKNGKYKDMIKLVDRGLADFIIQKDLSLLINSWGREFYFSVFKDGKFINEFGKTTIYNEKNNDLYTMGSIVINDMGNYVFYFRHVPIVKVYDVTGKLLFEKLLFEELNAKSYYDTKSPKALKNEGIHILINKFTLSVNYYNNMYYIMIYNNDEFRKDFQKNDIIIILNSDFVQVEMIYLPLKEIRDLPSEQNFLLPGISYGFEFTKDKKGFIIPKTYRGEIDLYLPKSK